MGFTMNFEDYEVTKEGQVINTKTGRILKGQANSKGYLRVSLCGKFYFIHRLVAEKYIPNPENKTQVNHIDGNKLNNCVDNLEWMTNKENRRHAVENGLQATGSKCLKKLDWDKVHYIREHLEVSNAKLAKKFNVSPTCIADVKNYRTWKEQLKRYAELTRIRSVRTKR